jgi:hypothetical protein
MLNTLKLNQNSFLDPFIWPKNGDWIPGRDRLSCSTASRSALGPSQPSFLRVLRALLQEVERSGHETDHLVVERSAWNYISFPSPPSPRILRDGCLSKHRDN